MSSKSEKRECRLHKDTGRGFCLLHGLYCCPSCHQNTYPNCSVSSIDHAASHLQQELKTSAAKLHNALQSCKTMKTTLNDQLDDAQHQRDEAIDHVTAFCDQLQSTIENFRQQGIDNIHALTANRTDTITEQLQTIEELDVFLSELSETVNIDHTGEETKTRNADHKSSGGHTDLFKLNIKSMELRDGLAQMESHEECVRDDFHISIFTLDDRTINEQLANQLTALGDAIGKSPEGCSKTSNSGRPVSPQQACWRVQSNQDNDVHSIYSGAGGAPDYQALDSVGDITKGDNRVPDSFREVTRFSHQGSHQAVRFARSSAGLYILIASNGSNKISKVDEYGRILVTKKTTRTTQDMFIRGDEVFVAATDRTIKVYRLEDLHLMRQIPTSGICGLIVCTDHDLVVTFPFDNNKRVVCRLSETGHLTHESSCKMVFPWGLAMTSGGTRILVSDSPAGKIFVLSADLKLIAQVGNRELVEPRGLCVVGESVFIACRDSVIELDSHGRYKRTVLDKEDGIVGIVDPYQLSYDAQSRKLVVTSAMQSEKIIVFVGDS